LGYKTEDVFFSNPISANLDSLSSFEPSSVVVFLNKDAAADPMADMGFTFYLPYYLIYLPTV
jgi:hypothetical protein